MKRRLPLMLWAAVWGIIVVVSASSMWWAISRAGAHVTGQAAQPLPTLTATATPRPTPGSAVTGSPSAPAVQGSWNGTAGRVTATCRKDAIKLKAAVPADGFTIEIENRGPSALEIEFHQSRGDREFKVRGTCTSHGPKFVVEQE